MNDSEMRKSKQTTLLASANRSPIEQLLEPGDKRSNRGTETVSFDSRRPDMDKGLISPGKQEDLNVHTNEDLFVLPKHFVLSKQQEKFLAAERIGDFSFRYVGKYPRLGVTWGTWLGFEEYVCSREPEIKPSNIPRFIFWRPLGQSKTPKGWFRFPFTTDIITRTGFAEIKDPKKYWANWNSDAKRLRNSFYRNNNVEVKEVSLEKYSHDYPQNGKYVSFRKRVMAKIKRYSDVFGSDHHFYEVIEKSTGIVRAGVSVADNLEHQYSFHVSGFIDRSAHDQSFGVGTIDFWFKESIKRGIRFIDFDVFWEEGNPKKWKGFSDFKKKFGVQFIHYPRTVIKFIWPKKVS